MIRIQVVPKKLITVCSSLAFLFMVGVVAVAIFPDHSVVLALGTGLMSSSVVSFFVYTIQKWDKRQCDIE